MYKLTTKEAIVEQLSLGNKFDSLQRTITIDLEKKTKDESIVATMQSYMIPQDEVEPPFLDLAEPWLDAVIDDHTLLVIKGRNGRTASVPFSKRESMLPRVIQRFNT